MSEPRSGSSSPESIDPPISPPIAQHSPGQNVGMPGRSGLPGSIPAFRSALRPIDRKRNATPGNLKIGDWVLVLAKPSQ